MSLDTTTEFKRLKLLVYFILLILVNFIKKWRQILQRVLLHLLLGKVVRVSWQALDKFWQGWSFRRTLSNLLDFLKRLYLLLKLTNVALQGGLRA